MLPAITIGLKVVLTAALVLSATLAAERMKPLWGGIIATIPLSSGAAHVMLALNENADFVARAALGSLVTSIAAFAYLAVFVTLAPRKRPFLSVCAAFFTWLALTVILANIAWTPLVAMAVNVIAFAIAFRVTRSQRSRAGTGVRSRPTRSEILWRGLAAGLLATIVSVTARIVGPTIAGMLAVFPVVYVSVAYIVQRRLGGEAAAATMASAVLPLVGVSLTFLTLSLLAPALGAWPALLCAFAVSIGWPLGIAMWHLYFDRRFAT